MRAMSTTKALDLSQVLKSLLYFVLHFIVYYYYYYYFNEIFGC